MRAQEGTYWPTASAIRSLWHRSRHLRTMARMGESRRGRFRLLSDWSGHSTETRRRECQARTSHWALCDYNLEYPKDLPTRQAHRGTTVDELLLHNGDERAIYIISLHGDDICLSLTGVEGNCGCVPEVDAGMHVEVLDFLPSPRLITGPDFQPAQVGARIGLTPTLGYGPCHHGGERAHEISAPGRSA